MDDKKLRKLSAVMSTASCRKSIWWLVEYGVLWYLYQFKRKAWLNGGICRSTNRRADDIEA